MGIERVDQPSRALLAKLRPRQRTFVLAYASDRLKNGSRAYRLAGYEGKNANVQHNGANQLLRRTTIQEAIAAVEAELQAGIKEVTPADIAQELQRIAFSDPRRMFDADGNRLEMHELGDDEAAAIKTVKVQRDETRKIGSETVVQEQVIELAVHDKLAALKTLASIKGMVVDRHKHDIELPLAQLMEQVNQLAAQRRQQQLPAPDGGEARLLPVIDAKATR